MQGDENFEPGQIPFYPVIPDHELKVWDKWTKVRHDDTAKLARKLDREPVDLAMNLLDKVRREKERKITLEHAQIDRKIGVRGAVWDRPQKLKQLCKCCPVYEVRRTRAEMGNPQIIEHIGIPKYVKQHELGMAGEPHRISCTLLNEDYNRYREKREEELKEKIKKIDPYRPDFTDLLVKGKRYPPTPPVILSVPEIKIEAAPKVGKQPSTSVYALKINDTVFFKDNPAHNLVHLKKLQEEGATHTCTSWTYYFNVPIKRAGRSEIHLHNLGTVAIKFSWKKTKRIIPFIPDDDRLCDHVFFFNKNEDVVSPGQTKDVLITFISEKAGTYCESWELSLENVNFFEKAPRKLAFNLYADSVESVQMVRRKVEVLKTRLNRKALHDFALEFVNDMVETIFETPLQIYPYQHFFLEAELFVMKNPVCFYHQTEVAKMKILYKEMDKHAGDWDLSIPTWRKKMMEKQFTDRMKYYELLRKSHSQFVKPWYEGQELIKEKYRVVSCFLGKLFDQFDIEYNKIIKRITQNSKPASPALVSNTTIHSKSNSRVKSIQCKINEVQMDPFTAHMVRMIFFIRIYEYFENTIELCAGVLSSIDLNRWIEFNFCKNF